LSRYHYNETSNGDIWRWTPKVGQPEGRDKLFARSLKSKTGIRQPGRTDVVIRNKPHPVFCRQELNGPCRGYSHLSIRQGRLAEPSRCQKSAGKGTDT